MTVRRCSTSIFVCPFFKFCFSSSGYYFWNISFFWFRAVSVYLCFVLRVFGLESCSALCRIVDLFAARDSNCHRVCCGPTDWNHAKVLVWAIKPKSEKRAKQVDIEKCLTVNNGKTLFDLDFCWSVFCSCLVRFSILVTEEISQVIYIYIEFI